MTRILTLTHATERDIDLLLVEELATSPDFVSWILSKVVGSRMEVYSSEVFHSTRRMFSRREIDINLSASTDRGEFLLLIENKLDTDEQPNQAKSYHDEAETLRNDGLKVYTVLVCPNGYARGHPKFTQAFDKAITYETIEGYFENTASVTQEALASRLRYRSKLMRQAVDKARRGYVQVIHPGKRAFSERYITLLEEMAPALIPGPSMLRHSGAESVTMIFAPQTLPAWSFLPRMRIVHQLRKANANINFYQWGESWACLADDVEAALKGTSFYATTSTNRRRNGSSSLMIAAQTPKVDQFGDFDGQLDAIKEGIQITAALRQWLIEHENEVQTWSSLVASE